MSYFPRARKLFDQVARSVPAYRSFRAWRARDWKFFCPVCEEKVPGFLPLPAFYFEQNAKYGSDLRMEDGETCNFKGYSCPNCEASDRDRLYAIYLKMRLEAQTLSSYRMLDIAPSAPLSRHIRQNYSLEYRTADLFMPGVDDRVDITRMDCYPDCSFDAFICSHVLEHIPDDRAAMSELFRVLKTGGWGIVMVPISVRLKEIREDATKTTEAERWKYFGQYDHVRVYNRSGLVERLDRAGFKTLALEEPFFGAEIFKRSGIATGSVLYVVEK